MRLTPNAPLAPGAPSGTLTDVSDPATVSTPVVGVRYWFSESLGIDLGLGFGFFTREDVNNLLPGGGAQYDGLDGVFALRFQAGLPISLKTYQHFNFLLIPELGFSYGQGTAFSAMSADQDVDFQNIGFDFNARVGGEIQFGFWGLPNLALQATVGLGFQYRQTTAADSRDPGDPFAVDLETTEVSLQTTANDIFNGTIRVLYYF